MTRPFPPAEIIEEMGDRFVPDEALGEWVFASFIDEDAPLVNEGHAHLREARIGFLWTNCDNAKQMRVVLGQAEIMPPMAMGKWQRARAVRQIEEWFGEVPDFMITIHAQSAATMDDVSFCALIEHELYHCGQERDIFGGPKFTQDGRPKFAMRGHDVEEFVGVVARYGSEATRVRELVEAGNAKPLIGTASIDGICGTCLRAAA